MDNLHGGQRRFFLLRAGLERQFVTDQGPVPLFPLRKKSGGGGEKKKQRHSDVDRRAAASHLLSELHGLLTGREANEFGGVVEVEREVRLLDAGGDLVARGRLEDVHEVEVRVRGSLQPRLEQLGVAPFH